MLESIWNGLLMALQPASLIAMTIGCVLGGWFGAMPGLTATMAIAILVPFTFFMEPMVGIPFLLGIYKGGMWGGSVPAILINVPGTGAAVATTIDGYEMAKQGFARKALVMALVSGVVAEFLADAWVLAVMEPLSRVALLFGAADFFSLILASLVVMATISDGTAVKGLVALGFGLFLATIGMDPAFGIARFAFGSMYLVDGFDFVPIVIGLFAFSEVLSAVVNRKNVSLSASIANDWGPPLTKKDYIDCWPPIWKATILGTLIGMIPAVGQPVSAFLGYGVEKKTGKNRDIMGKGAIEGVAAPEAANNAVNGGAMIPMLTFGIPGDTITAILLGAFMVQGLRPGPRLMIDNAEIMYGILASMLIGNIIMLGVGYVLIKPFSRIVMIPRKYLMPILIVLCFIGTYAIKNSMFDVGTGLVLGIVGFFLKRYNYSIGTVAIAFLLGGVMEKYMVQALAISQGDWSTFVQRPISAVFLVIAFVTLFFAFYNYRKKAQQAETAEI